jgi:hypothetical protein
MKIASKIILTFLLIPQLVFASQREQFRSLVDEYLYEMTVEWDQKDKVFSLNQGKQFQQGFAHLLNTGLDKSDIEAVLTSYQGIVNVERINLELRLLNVTNPTVLGQYLTKNVKELYSQGPSWNGGASNATIPLIAMSIFITVTFILLEGDAYLSSYQEPVCLEYKGQCYIECSENDETVDWLQNPCREVCSSYCM